MASLSYVVKAPRMNEMAAWLRCNDVNPDHVPYPSAVFLDADGAGWVIRFESYVHSDATGRILWDPVAVEFSVVERSVPLVIDPPMWWLSEAPPIGGGAPRGAPRAEGSATGGNSIKQGNGNH